MTKKILAALAASAALSSPLAAQIAPEKVAALRDAALKDDLAWDITEGLTTEIGPRQAGSEAEARARDWAVEKLKALGFQNVHIETFDVPWWERGDASAEITAPFPQSLTLAALGNSAATPAKGLSAEVIGFDSMAALEAADPATIKGKIVFVTHRMQPAQDGSPYGPVGQIRRAGPSVASKKGAVAILIRSIGTDHHRVPHTGVQAWTDGAKPIPALALANPDADQLERVLKRGKPVTIALTVTARMAGTRKSGNVIADVPGRDPNAGIVLVGGHLDSWDLGTGAIDDASGVAITTAAAKRIMDAGQPLRTIRVVWFGSEEIGLFGGAAYARAHAKEKHALAAESDFGADRVWRFSTAVKPEALPAMKPIAEALAPLGIVTNRKNGEAGGSDTDDLQRSGVPMVSLNQDGTRYFDLHHTADDTLDKIDPEQLRQNVAAWTTLLAITANDPTEYGPVTPPRE
ncbi:M28 family peptidase [Sphingomonas montanisoli]|uniref:Carboxypeptidase Q n=1 Tax=Sphingomonas montanisoli TaxID=2606412 RepID=A0A5D9CFH8_9SPHN|nr:M28 family peptidase [Sphingomonas montanisoli]TZG28891.1 M20/M25/M40 family metallo-hydrolase [Sphingomonas montanisoli]